MKKRVWSLFLALALCLAMMPMAALAETGSGNAAGGEQDNVHAVAAQTADDGNTSGAETAGGENGNSSENCTHAQVTQNAENHNYYCEKCKKQMFVKVKAADGTTTYGTDPAAAMKTAANGTTITLLADIDNNDKISMLGNGKKTVTLNLHGHTITVNGMTVMYNQNLIVVGHGSIKTTAPLSVETGATLDLRGWGGGENDTIDYVSLSKREPAVNLESTLLVGENMKGTIGRLDFVGTSSGITSKLNGGTYGQILIDVQYDSEPFSSLLAPGYAFQYTDEAHKGEFVEYTKTATKGDNTIHNVKVVKCPHAKVENNTCAYCGTAGIVATIDSTAYTKIDDAVAAWLTNGGTLTLHDNTGTNVIGHFSGAKAKDLVIDLNGHSIDDEEDEYSTPLMLKGVNLTIRDSKENDSEQGAFGTIVANSGSLTLESGYIKGLTVRGGEDTATIHLRGGKFKCGKECSKLPYDLLDDGYALMKGSDTVNPTECFQENTKYTIKNAQITDKSGATKDSTTIGSGTLPFDLSLKTSDKAIGRVQFYWYRIDDSGTAVLLAESKDVWPDEDGVYRYDTTTNGNDKDGWTGLQAEETYDLICVVAGKTIKGAYEWQTVLKGYQLTIDRANLASEKTVITQQVNSGNTGNKADNRLVVNPTNSYVGMSEDGLGEVSYLFDVTYNGIPLKADTDYTIKDNSDKAKNAGAHELTIEGKGNYTGTKTVKWKLEPYELPSKHPTTQITKPYDGTTDGKNVNGEAGLGIFAIDSNNTRNPKMWTNNITSIGFHDCFTLSDMHFDAAEVGDRTFYFTLTLKTDNFVFAGGKKSAQFELKRNGSAGPYIYMAVVAVPAAKDLQVANKHAATYTVDLAGMLPQLTAPCEYGKVTYTLGKVQLTDSSYYDGNSKPAKIENGKLILPIKEVDSSNEGEIGKVTVTVSSTNYLDIPLTINIHAVNKIIPALDGKLTLSKEKLTYGEQLSTITLSGAMTDPTDGSKTVAGTFAWAAPETAMNQVGDYQATWKFTPVKGDVYAETTGTVAIPVEQAVPIGTPLYKKITASDKTLADAKLKATEEAAEGTTAKSCFTANGREVAGTIKWVDKDGNDLTADLANIKVVQGESYKWLFTPTDQNYKELSGAIVLWAKPSSGGFVTPAPVNPDVITVKEDTKDNTTSKPGAETDTTTTTKTTVKTTTTEMTKNEQGQDVSKTTASVSKDLGDKLLDQAVSNKSDTIEITVKSSDANNGSGAGTGAADSMKSTEVELPKATVNAIAKDTNADLVIKTDNGEVVLDNKTLETIAGAAKGDTVTIVVGENTQLKETQKPAEKIVGKNGTLFDLAAKIGERLLHQFEGGKAHVTLPMPEKLKGKDVLVIYIDDNGLCKILNHSVEKIGAEDYIRFTTTHFSTFAVVDKDEAERLIKEQNAAHVKELMQSAKFKVTTTKTSKKSVKVQVTAKSSKTMISDIKSLGYTLKYQFYRSTKKTAGYKVIKTKAANTFTNTKGTKGTKYYYKARILVYDGKTLVAKSALRQCGWGSRTWTK